MSDTRAKFRRFSSQGRAYPPSRRARELLAALACVSGTEEILRILLSHALRTFRANSCAIVARDREEGGRFRVLAASHLEESALAMIGRLHVDDVSPLAEAFREGQAREARSLGEAVGAPPSKRRTRPGSAVLIVPLVTNGSAGSVLLIRRLSVAPFAPRRLAALEAWRSVCALAVERVRLILAEESARTLARETERTARRFAALAAEANRAARRSDLLAAVSRELSDLLDYRKSLAALARLTVPYFADFSTVSLAGEDGVLRCIGVAHREPAQEDLLIDLHRRFPGFADASARELIGSGKGALTEDVSAATLRALAAASGAPLDLLQRLHARSWIRVPLLVRGTTLGVLTFVTAESGRVYSHDDLELAEEVGKRAALALDNALLYQRARQAIAARDEFLGLVSHDLKNPLAGVLLNVQMMRRSLEASNLDGIRKSVETLQSAADRMNHLVTGLLNIANSETGSLTLERAPHRLDELVMAAVNLLRHLAESQGVRIEIRIGDRSAQAYCDPERVCDALFELLKNAIQFSPRGEAVIVAAEPRGDRIEVSVSDRGPGIAHERVPHLFERFRGDEGVQKMRAGLGLPLARALIEGHGGNIWVEARPEGGSRFVFSLPRADLHRMLAPAQ